MRIELEEGDSADEILQAMRVALRNPNSAGENDHYQNDDNEYDIINYLRLSSEYLKENPDVHRVARGRFAFYNYSTRIKFNDYSLRRLRLDRIVSCIHESLMIILFFILQGYVETNK